MGVDHDNEATRERLPQQNETLLIIRMSLATIMGPAFGHKHGTTPVTAVPTTR